MRTSVRELVVRCSTSSSLHDDALLHLPPLLLFHPVTLQSAEASMQGLLKHPSCLRNEVYFALDDLICRYFDAFQVNLQRMFGVRSFLLQTLITAATARLHAAAVAVNQRATSVWSNVTKQVEIDIQII
jgi:hypothetical protein